MTTSTLNKPQQSPSSTKDDATALPVHKASEKRRAQNRAAQKTYREKRKKRLQELEQLATSAGLISNSSSSSTSPPDLNQLSEPQPTPQDDPLISSSFDSSDLFQLKDFLDDPLDPRSTTTSNWSSTTIDSQSHPDWLAASSGLTSFVDFSQPLPFTGSSQFNPTSMTSSSNGFNSTELTKVSKHHGIDTNMGQHDFAAWKAVIESGIPFADPYSNTLRLHQTTVCWAFYQNVIHIGLDESICADDAVSPFYRPGVTESDTSSIKSVQDTFGCIKRDLRPTKEQITVKHAGYIDILPFPDIRTRIIELQSYDPPLFDEDQFWSDIESGGLMCWGSISVRKNGPSTGSGAPWDSRSWEAKTWFLAKWSFIVGGEDGELSRSSEWWREIRGVGQGFSF